MWFGLSGWLGLGVRLGPTRSWFMHGVFPSPSTSCNLLSYRLDLWRNLLDSVEWAKTASILITVIQCIVLVGGWALRWAGGGMGFKFRDFKFLIILLLLNVNGELCFNFSCKLRLFCCKIFFGKWFQICEGLFHYKIMVK